jgi:flagellar assembly factor FliW
MKLTTARFGELAYDEGQMVEFPGGLHSLAPHSHCVLIDEPASAPFQWLVCVEHPEFALTLLDPALVLNEGSGPAVQVQETTTFVVATPGSGDVAWWLDLRHPILINAGQRQGEQVTLDDVSLPERFPVTLEQPFETAE